MAFLDDLQSHRGGLLELRTQLYWYWPRGRGWDSTPGRLCLLLDSTADVGEGADAADAVAVGWQGRHRAVVLLLIDGHPRWVWVAEEDVEFL